MRNPGILALAESALADSWRRIKGDRCFRAKPVGYVNRPEDNLLPTVSLANIADDYRSAAGHELENKFCAAYSSSALVANCFGPFRKDGPIPVVAGANGLTSLRFEKRLPHGLPSESPNLDVVIAGADALVAIESKCTEHLRRKHGEFKCAYDSLVEKMEAGWREVFKAIRKQSDRFGGLDAAQLVKHYLGIRHSAKEHRKVLLYLFWEPLNAHTLLAFKDHRRRIVEFSEMVRGSEVEFQYQSYPELWRSWSSGASASPVVSEHLRQLEKRYSVELVV
jgi:hypothetical protein